jgi:glyoxylase-like metal-dependent hydrolase (beta-lactamase superfamily II)
MKVGDIEILPVIDGTVHLPASRVYGMRGAVAGAKGQDPADWEPHRYLLDHDGKVELTLGGFLVVARGRLVLVDAGIADLGFGPFRGGAMLDSLRALGYEPADITDVVLTHLHADHIGWTSQAGRLVFPHATYRCDTRDWEHFAGAAPGPGDPPPDRLATLEAQLETWDGSVSLLPGVDTVAAYGHTPGSCVVVVSSGTSRAMILGDAVHCAVELLDDDWTRIGDVDPDLARRTRAALVRELAGTSTVVAGAHFPGMRFGRVLPGEGVRRWVMA